MRATLLRILGMSPSGTASDREAGAVTTGNGAEFFCTFGALNSWIPQGRHISRLKFEWKPKFLIVAKPCPRIMSTWACMYCVVGLLHQDPQMPGLPSLCFFWGGGPIGSARADNSCMVTSYRQGFKCVRQMNPPASSLGLTFAAPSFPSRLRYLVLEALGSVRACGWPGTQLAGLAY